MPTPGHQASLARLMRCEDLHESVAEALAAHSAAELTAWGVNQARRDGLNSHVGGHRSSAAVALRRTVHPALVAGRLATQHAMGAAVTD